MAKRAAAVNSGDLRHVIRIEEPYDTGTGRANEPIVGWRKWKDAYASIKNKPGREYYQQGPNYPSTAGEMRSEQIYMFSFRYAEVLGIDFTMRLRFNGETYNITDVRPDHLNLTETIVQARVVK